MTTLTVHDEVLKRTPLGMIPTELTRDMTLRHDAATMSMVLTGTPEQVEAITKHMESLPIHTGFQPPPTTRTRKVRQGVLDGSS